MMLEGVPERMLEMVQPEPNSGCWLWIGATTNGYGVTSLNGVLYRAHRVFFEATHGPVKMGLQIDHLCRVRSCVNPDHLEAVTQQENIARGDGGAHWRNKTHCPSGHPYSGDNLYLNSKGYRWCKTCRREQQISYVERKRLELKSS